MLLLPEENIIDICDKLTDNEKILFTSISLNMDKLKHKLIYRDIWILEKINRLPYFDNFENIVIQRQDTKFPKYAKYVHHTAFISNVPSNVTHLILSDYLLSPELYGLIPGSVTHLEFGYYFDQPIENHIPKSVTHLKFGYHFNRPIKNAIPSSIIRLTFGRNFNQEIDLSILPKIARLRLNKLFDKSLIRNIPLVAPEIIFDH
jgi:hypothetical protein